MPDGSSPTIAPTTEAVAEILNAVNRNGADAGRRSFQRTVRLMPMCAPMPITPRMRPERSSPKS